MSAWIIGEEAPDCYCGWPLRVADDGEGGFALMCLGHTREAGAMFKLPSEKPDDWPTPTQLEQVGIRWAKHVETEEGYICICCECCNKRKKEEDESSK